MFVNFAKKQSDNLEQQDVSPLGSGKSPLQRIFSLLKARTANTELNALISEAPEELESDDDEGLISFEEERVSRSCLEFSVSVFIEVQREGYTGEGAAGPTSVKQSGSNMRQTEI